MFFHKKNRYELDMTTANNALQNILSTCNQPVNTIPFDKLVLRKKVNAASYNRLIVASGDLRADLSVSLSHRSALRI